MADRLLRTICVELPGAPGEYYQQDRYYIGHDAEGGPIRQDLTLVFSCSPYNLPAGTELERYCVNPATNNLQGGLQVVTYDGDGGFINQPIILDSPECPVGCRLGVEVQSTKNPSAAGGSDGQIIFRTTTYNPPVSLFLPGQQTQQQQGDQTPLGGWVAYFTYPNLPAGRYTAQAEDANNCRLNSEEAVLGDPTNTGDVGAEPAKWLKYVVSESSTMGYDPVTGDPVVQYDVQGTAWDEAKREVYPALFRTLTVRDNYSRPVAEVVDSYYLPDGKTFRKVHHDGLGGVTFEDIVPGGDTAIGDLVILNIIKTDIDAPGTEDGSVWIEAVSPSMPIKYHMRPGVRAGYVQDNFTGQFGQLYAGHYIVDIYDAAGRYVAAEFDIEDRYRVRWQLAADDQPGRPLEIYLFKRDYKGLPEDVCGNDHPVVYGWDGGNDPSGYLPEVQGMTATFSLRTSKEREFADVANGNDRLFRADVYVAQKLVFRGYIASDSYEEPLLGEGQTVTFTASDGLGPLNQTLFLNHVGDPMVGRRPLLATILHCLSRCDVNIPLYCGVNLRDQLMAAESDPLLESWALRTAYDKKDSSELITDADVVDCRTVLNAILRSFNAFMFQRSGAWWVMDLSEVDTDYTLRGWNPNGTVVPAIRPEPLHILPPLQATAPLEVNWVTAGQRVRIVAAAKVAQATVKLQLENNLLDNGSFQQWTADLARPLNWIVQGARVQQVIGKQARTYAVRLMGETVAAETHLLSPAIPHLPAPDEDSTKLSITAKLDGGYAARSSTLVAFSSGATLRVGITADGVDTGQDLTFEWSSQDDYKTQSQYLPLGLGGKSLRLKVYSPTVTAATFGVNAGGPQLANTLGSFVADTYYSASTTGSNSIAISGTSEPTLYQTERTGTDFNYHIPVANGSYRITLYFAEIYFDKAGQRIFNVSINGQAVLTHYDIVAKVGANAATLESFPVTVTGEQLNIVFSSSTASGGVGEAKISGIKIQATTTSGALDYGLRLDEVALAIQPGLVEWPDTDAGAVAVNPREAYLLLPAVELVHADMPRLPGANGLPAPAFAMDVFAWRHALSLADYQATSLWRRPTMPVGSVGLPLLDLAAQDRLELREAPVDILSGVLQGPAVPLLGVGLMVDAVRDADGKFLVVGCSVDGRTGQATVVLRKLRAGSYTDELLLPDRLRVTAKGPRRSRPGLRIAGEVDG